MKKATIFSSVLLAASLLVGPTVSAAGDAAVGPVGGQVRGLAVAFDGVECLQPGVGIFSAQLKPHKRGTDHPPNAGIGFDLFQTKAGGHERFLFPHPLPFPSR